MHFFSCCLRCLYAVVEWLDLSLTSTGIDLARNLSHSVGIDEICNLRLWSLELVGPCESGGEGEVFAVPETPQEIYFMSINKRPHVADRRNDLQIGLTADTMNQRALADRLDSA